MYVCTYVLMYVCMCVCMYVCMCVCMYVYVCMCVCVCMYVGFLSAFKLSVVVGPRLVFSEIFQYHLLFNLSVRAVACSHPLFVYHCTTESVKVKTLRNLLCVMIFIFITKQLCYCQIMYF
jgi:hypothetical protein